MRKWKRGKVAVITEDDIEVTGIRYSKLPESTATEPRGVRICHADGTVSECSLVRDPEDDEDGCAQWVAMPAAGTVISDGDYLAIDEMPGRTRVSLSLER